MAKQLTQPNKSLPSIQGGLTKKQLASLAQQSVDAILEEGNAIQVAEALATMEEFVQRVRRDERFIDFLRDELLKHHGKVITASGARIETCEAGVSYDYSGDTTWRLLDEQVKLLIGQKKEVEEKLRRIIPGKMAVDTETGEVLEGPLKTSKSTYRITLAK